MKTLRIPEATVMRMSVYSRYLERLDQNGIIMVSSGEIADGVGVSPAQVRKDLAYFGEFGTRGVGYNVKDLLRYTLKILGLDRKWNLILAGAGNLGYAFCTNTNMIERGFNIVGIFDDDLAKIGRKVNEMTVLPLEEMERIIKENDVKIGVLTMSSGATVQIVAEMMVRSGIIALLNFSSVPLSVSDTVEVRNVDMSVSLEILTFNLGFKAAQLL